MLDTLDTLQRLQGKIWKTITQLEEWWQLADSWELEVIRKIALRLLELLSPYEFLWKDNKFEITFWLMWIQGLNKLEETFRILLENWFQTANQIKLAFKIIKLAYESTIRFNWINKIRWLEKDMTEITVPFDEFKILNIKQKKIIFRATMRKKLNFLKEKEISMFIEKAKDYPIWSIIIEEDRTWTFPDICIKLTDDHIFLINCSIFSIQELRDRWDMDWVIELLEENYKQFVSESELNSLL